MMGLKVNPMKIRVGEYW
ncbi:hypothetical protein Godav_001104 [Gossypium davidsonii]|uniref:Uncharacterized protein n=1 Tax=Gossypium davidsonii TaxID=34287 RepID=A0A7J8T2B0_GOSDV|nr:hypothetical protein [Gossypium davidsonii]